MRIYLVRVTDHASNSVMHILWTHSIKVAKTCFRDECGEASLTESVEIVRFRFKDGLSAATLCDFLHDEEEADIVDAQVILLRAAPAMSQGKG